MRRIYDFVDKLFEDVPNSERAQLVREEIILDMEEKVYDLMDQGKSEEDAINKVMIEFGDFDEIREELQIGGSKKLAFAKLNMGFAICGSLLLIALFIFINMYYTPNTIWFVYPAFGVIWWPLSMIYYYFRKKEELK
ncbi:permease prefix domain 1-containing protein [Listeria costaricensis]|uniref:permease prefix domain 1-containing protein n=1 Tax=Listeria costaricensis TaxID=2026604 RepID=UPI000C08D9F6|nr:permease prefix domain 1-containing protein [Listeria costaricensis]